MEQVLREYKANQAAPSRDRTGCRCVSSSVRRGDPCSNSASVGRRKTKKTGTGFRAGWRSCPTFIVRNHPGAQILQGSRYWAFARCAGLSVCLATPLAIELQSPASAMWHPIGIGISEPTTKGVARNGWYPRDKRLGNHLVLPPHGG